MKKPRSLRRASGAGLIETVIAVTLSVIILGGVVQSTNRGLGAFRMGSATNDIESRAARVMSRVARELLGASAGNVQPDLNTPAGVPTVWTSVLDFTVGQRWQDGAVVWSTPRRLAWELSAGELDNGIDDDADGVVDQGVLTLTENPGTADERRTVLVSGVRELLEGETQNGLDDNGNGLVDEGGLAFDLSGEILSVRLSLERLGPDQRPLVRTQQTSIRLRNSRS